MFAKKIAFGTVRAAGLLAFFLLAGCESAQQKAIDQAKAQAAATNTPQQVQYIDGQGNTITTTVQPPAAPGQQPMVSTTTTPPPPGQPVPHSTAPVISQVAPPPADLIGPAQGYPNTATTTAAATQPAPVYPAAAPAQPAPVQGQPAAPPPAYNLTVPAGTEMAIRINQNINVKHTMAGDRFTGEVAAPVVRNGQVIIPRGTPVRGRVDAAHRRGHFKGRSILELRLTSMVLNGNEYALDTHENVHTKKGKGKRTAGFIGGLTGAGALIGGIASGGVGLAIGAASGAGAGTLIAGTTGNRDIDIPAESIVHFRLADDLVVQN